MFPGNNAAQFVPTVILVRSARLKIHMEPPKLLQWDNMEPPKLHPSRLTQEERGNNQ